MRTMYEQKICNLCHIFVVLAVLIACGAAPLIAQNSYERTLKFQFLTNGNPNVAVNNKFGNITISNWDKDEVSISTRIVVKGEGDDLEERIDDLKVKTNRSDNMIKVEAIYPEMSWWERLIYDEVEFEVHQHITMPIEGSVNLNNDYGDILIDELNGNVIINCDYGNVVLGRINGANNNINIDYSPKSRIEYVRSLDLNMDYSKLEIQKCETLDYNGDYSHLRLNEANRISANTDYGSIGINNVAELSVNSDYTSTDVNYLSKRLILKADYGAFKVDELSPEFSNLEVSADYLSFSAALPDEMAFNLYIKADGSALKLPEDLVYNENDQDGLSKRIKAYRIHNNSNTLLSLKSNYGKIRLTLSE